MLDGETNGADGCHRPQLDQASHGGRREWRARSAATISGVFFFSAPAPMEKDKMSRGKKTQLS